MESTRPPPAPPAAPPAAPPESVVGDIERFLEGALADLEPEPPRGGPGRSRILPSLCLWAGLLVCVLRGFAGQSAVWRLLTVRGLWDYPRFPVTDQAVYARLAAAGTAPLEALFAQVSAVLAARLAPYADRTLAAFAADVVAIDQMTLDRVARLLPALRAAKPGAAALLPGKLAAIFDLRRQQFRHVEHVASPTQNEKLAARGLLDRLQPGTLILADLGYFAFAWFDELTRRGFWWLSRLRDKTSYVVLHAYYDRDGVFDGLIHLGKYRADRAAHVVRLVRFTVGATEYRYITNVTDPALLPLHEVARLYPRRWDIELAFKTIKRELGLHLLWGAKPTIVLQQLWAVLIIAQVLQALRLEVAGLAGVDPFDVSLPLLVRYAPQFAADGRDPVHAFLEHGRRAGFSRPSSRTKPRAPVIASADLVPPPAGLALVRTPRHAHRRSPPKPSQSK